jgi:outer membrane protein assembly factor BamB
VAFDAGVRALDGPTGREVWNTKIAGRPSTGTVIGSEIFLVAEKADKLLVLDSVTGQLKSQMTLKDEAVGPPVLLVSAQGRQLLIPLKAGMMELRSLDGEYLRSVRTGAEVTTQPVVVTTSRGDVLLLGLKNGLAAFDASTVEPLGRIAIEADDYPVGNLSVVDLNGDKLVDVVMTTNGGRVIAVDVADGKIRWSTEVGQVSTPAFADLDADARLDLIVPGKTNFAIGLSGISGSVIWESGEDASFAKMTNVETRSLAVATVTDGRLIVVGTDRSAAGLRAFEVPKSSAKSSQ